MLRPKIPNAIVNLEYNVHFILLIYTSDLQFLHDERQCHVFATVPQSRLQNKLERVLRALIMQLSQMTTL